MEKMDEYPGAAYMHTCHVNNTFTSDCILQELDFFWKIILNMECNEKIMILKVTARGKMLMLLLLFLLILLLFLVVAEYVEKWFPLSILLQVLFKTMEIEANQYWFLIKQLENDYKFI